jgi:TPR repeat protein
LFGLRRVAVKLLVPFAAIALVQLMLVSLSLADNATGYAAYENKNYPLAFTEWQSSAEAGDAIAQFNLSHLYFDGLGTTADHVKGTEWLIKSAQKGYVDAQYNLGNNYAAGQLGVPLDLGQAVHWLTKASEQGDASAQYNLGLLYQNNETVKDFERAAFWYGKAASQDHAGAQANLGVLHYNGQGVTKSEAMAWVLYQKADAKDNPVAARLIGDMYERGTHVAADNSQAMRYYRRAAYGEDYKANMVLAFRYRDGKNVDLDLVLAHAYFTVGELLARQNSQHYELEIPAIREFQKDTASKLSEGQLTESNGLVEGFLARRPLPERSMTWGN